MLITDEVRKAFPSLTDAEIERFYKSAATTEQGQSGEVLFLAEIALVFGWQAMKDFLIAEVGSDELEASDFADLLLAAREIENGKRLFDLTALFGSAAEPTTKQSARARNKSFKELKEVLT